jgi:hypothetical protein
MLVVAYRKRTISSLLLPLQLSCIQHYTHTHTNARAASRDTESRDIMYDTKSTVLHAHSASAIVLLFRNLPQKDYPL